MFDRVENATLMSDSTVQLEIRTTNADDDGKTSSSHAPPVVIVQKGTALPPALRSMDVITVETSGDSVRVRQPNDRNGRSLRTGEPLRMTGVELLLLRPPTSTAAAAGLAPAPASASPLASPVTARPAQTVVSAAAAPTIGSTIAATVTPRPLPPRAPAASPFVQSVIPPTPATSPELAGTKPALRLMLPSGVVVFYELPTAEGAEVIVGRSPKTSGICIDDRAVQPKHLRLTRFGSTFRAVDLSEGSKTKLNLDALVWPADLVDGDELTMGGVTLRYVARCTASTMLPVRSASGHALAHTGKAAMPASDSPWVGSSSDSTPRPTQSSAPAAPLPAFSPMPRAMPQPGADLIAPQTTNTPAPAPVPAGLASWTPAAASNAPAASPWAAAQPATPSAPATVGLATQRELGPLAYMSLQTLLVWLGIGVVGLLGVVLGLAALVMNK